VFAWQRIEEERQYDTPDKAPASKPSHHEVDEDGFSIGSVSDDSEDLDNIIAGDYSFIVSSSGFELGFGVKEDLGDKIREAFHRRPYRRR
jgi:hypothetical protein